jgi:hypothetical protein
MQSVPAVFHTKQFVQGSTSSVKIANLEPVRAFITLQQCNLYSHELTRFHSGNGAENMRNPDFSNGAAR